MGFLYRCACVERERINFAYRVQKFTHEQHTCVMVRATSCIHFRRLSLYVWIIHSLSYVCLFTCFCCCISHNRICTLLDLRCTRVMTSYGQPRARCCVTRSPLPSFVFGRAIEWTFSKRACAHGAVVGTKPVNKSRCGRAVCVCERFRVLCYSSVCYTDDKLCLCFSLLMREYFLTFDLLTVAVEMLSISCGLISNWLLLFLFYRQSGGVFRLYGGIFGWCHCQEATLQSSVPSRVHWHLAAIGNFFVKFKF